MAIPEQDIQLIINDAIRRLRDDGLYTSALDNVRWYRDTIDAPLSASPVGTFGTHSPLDLIIEDIIRPIVGYYSTSAIGISSLGFSVSDPLSAIGTLIGLKYNIDNLVVTNGQLNTIQDISVSSSPTFRTINVPDLTNGQIVIVSGGRFITSAISINDSSQYLITYPVTSERNIIEGSVVLLTLRKGDYSTTDLFQIQENDSTNILFVTSAGTLITSGSIIIEDGLNVSGSLFVGTLSGMLSGADGKITVIPVIPISVGGTNNSSYSGAQFLWYNGEQLTSSPFSSASFLTSANGTFNFHSKFIGPNQIVNSIVSDDGSDVTINGGLIVTDLVGVGERYVTVASDGSFRTTSGAIGSVSGSGSGTVDRLSKFTTSGTIGDSIVIEIGSLIRVDGNLSVIGDGHYTSNLYVSGASSYFHGNITMDSLNVSGHSRLSSVSSNQIAYADGENSTLVGSANLTWSGLNIGVTGGIIATSNINVSGAIYVNSLAGSTTRFLGINSAGQMIIVGNTNRIPKFNTSLSLNDSIMLQNSTTILVEGSISASTNIFTRGLNVSGSVSVNSLAGSTTRFLGVNSAGLLTIVGNVSADINGSLNRIPKFNTPISLNDSIMLQNSTIILVEGSLSASNLTSLNKLNVSAAAYFVTSVAMLSNLQVDGNIYLGSSSSRITNDAGYTNGIYSLNATSTAYVQLNDSATINVRFAPAGHGNPYNYFRRGVMIGTDDSAVGGYLDVRATGTGDVVASFGGVASGNVDRPGGVYFSNVYNINSGLNVNAAHTLGINAAGYGNSTSQVRNLAIYDGTGVQIAYFAGSSRSLIIGTGTSTGSVLDVTGAVTFNGDIAVGGDIGAEDISGDILSVHESFILDNDGRGTATLTASPVNKNVVGISRLHITSVTGSGINGTLNLTVPTDGQQLWVFNNTGFAVFLDGAIEVGPGKESILIIYDNTLAAWQQALS